MHSQGAPSRQKGQSPPEWSLLSRLPAGPCERAWPTGGLAGFLSIPCRPAHGAADWFSPHLMENLLNRTESLLYDHSSVSFL